MFKIFAAGEAFARREVEEIHCLKEEAVVTPSAEILLVLRWRALVFKVTVGLSEWHDAHSLECSRSEEVLLACGIEPDKNIAGNLRGLDMLDHCLELRSEVDLRQVPCDVDCAFESDLVEERGLLLVHDADIYAMEVDRLTLVEQILCSGAPLGVGKEVVVQDLYPLSIRVELVRCDGADVTFLVADEAERTVADAASAEELNAERTPRVDGVVQESAILDGGGSFDLMS